MFLSTPFPPTSSFKATLRFSFFAGIIVFLILYLFRPFNIDGPENHLVFWHPVVYGLATFVMVLLNSSLLPLLFDKWYQEASWTIGKEILAMSWQILTIAFVNLVITHILFGEAMNLGTVINFLFITASVGIFPVAFIVLIKQQLLYRKFAAAAFVIERDLQSEQTSVQSEETSSTVLIKGDGQAEEIIMADRDLKYISSADNYLRIHFNQNGIITSKVIRSSLKKAEAMLGKHPSFYRCHRTFIVNLSAVSHISGNAQGFKLHLKDVDEIIPVSRSLNDELREKLNEFRLSNDR